MSLDYLHLPFAPIAKSRRRRHHRPRPLHRAHLAPAAAGIQPHRPIRRSPQPGLLVPPAASAAFAVRREADRIEIETEHLLLRYTENARGFTPVTLSHHAQSHGITWCYGDRIWTADNLRGTTRTLDEANGRVDLEPGLMARNGWAVVDDSRSLVFTDRRLARPRARRPTTWISTSLATATTTWAASRISSRWPGQTPLIPRCILGNWWSRYWAYNEAELKALMAEFRARDISPLRLHHRHGLAHHPDRQPLGAGPATPGTGSCSPTRQASSPGSTSRG